MSDLLWGCYNHSTLYCWVQKYGPEIEKWLRWHRKGFGTTSWRVDETYIKVKGQWKYFYRAVDSKGYMLDFYLFHTRNAKAAATFLQKYLNKSAEFIQLKKINSDFNPAYNAFLRKLKTTGKCFEHLIKPTTLGFKEMKTAYTTLKVFETMHIFRKRQFNA